MEKRDQQPDGTLLDGKGLPLADGLPAVYMRFEVFHAIDFNDFEFGTFVGEQ